jgi:hypothetical protein
MATTAPSARRQSSDIKKPQGVQITDRRFIRFDSSFGTNVPRTVLTVCMQHLFASSEDTFVRMHNHTPGDKLTGLPDGGNMSICTQNNVIDKTRYITGCSVEGSILLKIPGKNDADIIAANSQQIIDAIEIHFGAARRSFRHSKWKFNGVKQTLGDALIDFPQHFWLKLF